jgi:hypothetical protein
MPPIHKPLCHKELRRRIAFFTGENDLTHKHNPSP